jgi:hypothetical protein
LEKIPLSSMPRNAVDISLSLQGLGLISGIGGTALSERR